MRFDPRKEMAFITRMTDALVDWEQLDMMADGFTPDFVEIYRDFLAQTPELLADLEACLTRGDIAGTKDAAHKIKGSCANFGFIGVSQPAAEIELRAKERASLEGSLEAFQAARASFQAAREEVAAKRGV